MIFSIVKMHTNALKYLYIKCKITIFKNLQKNYCIFFQNELKYIIGKIRKAYFPKVWFKKIK